MKRFIRVMSSAAMVVLVLLFVAIVVLWVRSHYVRDYAWAWVPWSGDAAGARSIKVDFDSGGGQVVVDWQIWKSAKREELQQRNELAKLNWYHKTFADLPKQYAQSFPPTIWNAIGFKSYSGPTHRSIGVPYWACSLVTGMLPAAWVLRIVRRWRKRQLAAAERCLVCGYDLRATPGKCPECGTEVASTRGG